MVSEAVALAVGGAFLSSFMNVLFDRVATFQVLESLSNVFMGPKLRDDLLQKMETFMLTVDKVLGDAEEKQIMNPSVQKWLDKLKDAAYEVEDLLDDIGIEGPAQEKQAKEFNSRLENIVSKLEIIAVEKDYLGLKEGQFGGKSSSRFATTCLLDKSEVCFRKDDKVHILDILLSDGFKDIPVIAMVGMAGIGKSTLTRFLYNDMKVKNCFKLRAWVYLSEEFDVFKVTKTIYESLTLLHSDIKDLNILQVKMENKLRGRKFLLVLDNVWNESSREWDLLRRPFQVGAPGSKIIMTTRSRSVSSTIHGVLVHDLKRLPREDCWSLFAKHAFGDRDPDEDSDLKRIGEKIVKKCNGLPLAIKTLASLLHSEVETEEWNNVLHSRIWDLPYHKSDILPALRLSYHYLPSQLKRCFAYCSIFPKGHEFEKRDLVRMWIAEGLVQLPNRRRRMEDVGEQYFHELFSRSIFLQSLQDQSYFVMHDLVSDLAQHIAGEFCFKFEDDSSPPNPARVRYLSCRPGDTHDKFEAFYGKNKVLRTFLPLRSRNLTKTPFQPAVFRNLFPASSRLRVLSLSSYKILEFPDSICDLKQLRYLDLSGATIQSLPERVGNLYNLETLKLSRCPRLTRLEGNLSNLTRLEHLDVSGSLNLELLDSIGELKRLGYLDLSGTKIQCLPEGVCFLYNLQTLKLSGCPHLNSLPTDMKNLTKLEHLNINGTPVSDLPNSIGELKQLGYLDLSGTQIQYLPKGVCSLYNLRTLKLSRCLCLTRLPTDMKNLTKLKHLDIKETPLVELLDSIGDLKQLAYLDLSCTQIQCLPERLCCLYNLQKLKLSSCRHLTFLPTDMKNLTKLEHLDIEETPILQMPPKFGNLKCLQELTNFVVGNNSVSSISEMKDLSLLRGTLSILRLQNVSRTTDAEMASLKDKKYLQGLIFEWDADSCNGNTQSAGNNPPNYHTQTGNGPPNHNAKNAALGPYKTNPQNGITQIGDSTEDDVLQNHRVTHASEVLDKLQPGDNLETLEIKNFFGMSLPNWLGNASFSLMERLTLENCQNCNSLPPLGLLPSLKELVILKLTGVKRIGEEFYGDGVVAFKSLKTLQFKEMENWEEWLPFENGGFPSLVKLDMIGCGKLTGELLIMQLPNLQCSIDRCAKLRYQGTTSP